VALKVMVPAARNGAALVRLTVTEPVARSVAARAPRMAARLTVTAARVAAVARRF